MSDKPLQRTERPSSPAPARGWARRWRWRCRAPGARAGAGLAQPGPAPGRRRRGRAHARHGQPRCSWPMSPRRTRRANASESRGHRRRFGPDADPDQQRRPQHPQTPSHEFTPAMNGAPCSTPNLTGVFLMCRALNLHLKGSGLRPRPQPGTAHHERHVGLAQRTAYCAASKSRPARSSPARWRSNSPQNASPSTASAPGPVRHRDEPRPSSRTPEANAQFISKIPAGRWGEVR